MTGGHWNRGGVNKIKIERLKNVSFQREVSWKFVCYFSGLDSSKNLIEPLPGVDLCSYIELMWIPVLTFSLLSCQFEAHWCGVSLLKVLICGLVSNIIEHRHTVVDTNVSQYAWLYSTVLNMPNLGSNYILY